MSPFERGSAATGECQLQNSVALHPRRRTPVKRNKRIFCQFAYNDHNQRMCFSCGYYNFYGAIRLIFFTGGAYRKKCPTIDCGCRADLKLTVV